MILKSLTWLPTICYICADKLLVNPLYKESTTVYCPTHGDFFIQHFNDRDPVVTFVPFPEEEIDEATKLDDPLPSPAAPRIGNPGTLLQCEQTGKRFPSMAAASREMNLNLSCLIQQLNGRRRSVSGYTFKRLDSIHDSIDELKPMVPSLIRNRKIRCDQTGEIFPSIRDAARVLHVDRETIRGHLMGVFGLVKGEYTFTEVI